MEMEQTNPESLAAPAPVPAPAARPRRAIKPPQKYEPDVSSLEDDLSVDDDWDASSDGATIESSVPGEDEYEKDSFLADDDSIEFESDAEDDEESEESTETEDSEDEDDDEDDEDEEDEEEEDDEEDDDEEEDEEDDEEEQRRREAKRALKRQESAGLLAFEAGVQTSARCPDKTDKMFLRAVFNEVSRGCARSAEARSAWYAMNYEQQELLLLILMRKYDAKTQPLPQECLDAYRLVAKTYLEVNGFEIGEFFLL